MTAFAHATARSRSGATSSGSSHERHAAVPRVVSGDSPAFLQPAIPAPALGSERPWRRVERPASPASGAVVQTKCGPCAEEEEEAERGMGAVRKKDSGAAPTDGGRVHAWARSGVDGATRPLPHLGRLQASFGRHDLSDVRVNVGGAAAASNRAIGALAYTMGDRIGFAGEPDVRLAAHEATHVVQQRRGVHLAGGVGRSGDPFEQQADAVAEAVHRGERVESMLDAASRGGSARPGVQRQDGGVPGSSDATSLDAGVPSGGTYTDAGAPSGGTYGDAGVPSGGTTVDPVAGVSAPPGAGTTTPGAAQEEDPCPIRERELTNAALLSTFARAFAWLRAHRRSDDKYNDWSHLMRRLIDERRRRVNQGESWMGENISGVPDQVYRLEPDASTPLQFTVTPMSGGAVAGNAQDRSGQPVVTRGQYFEILARNRLPRVDPEEHQRAAGATPLTIQLPLPEPPPAASPFLDPLAMDYDPLNPLRVPWTTGAMLSGAGPMFGAGPTPTAGDSLQRFLGQVWSAHQASPIASDDPIYGMYNRRPTPIAHSIDRATYRQQALSLSSGGTVPEVQVGSGIYALGSEPAGRVEGFYHYSPQSSPIRYRVYVSVSPEHALDLMRIVVGEFVEGSQGRVPASKVGSERIVSARRDGLLVTASDLPTLERILLRLRGLQQQNPTWFAGEPVAMADPILPSIGLGVEPASHASFGQERSTLIYRALQGATTEAQFRANVERLLLQSGVDPAAPHAQRDLLTLAPERRAWLQAGGSSVGAYHTGGLRSPAVIGTGTGMAMGGLLTAGDVLLHGDRHPHAGRDIALGTGLGGAQGYAAGQMELAMNARWSPVQYTRFNATFGQGMRGMVMPRMGSGGIAGGATAIATTLLALGIHQAAGEDIIFNDYLALGTRAGVSGTLAGAGGAGAMALTGFLAGSEVPILGNIIGAGVGLLIYWGSDALFGQSIENGVRGLLGEGGCTR